MCRVTMGHLRVNVGHLRVTIRAGNFLDRSENGGIVEPFRAP